MRRHIISLVLLSSTLTLAGQEVGDQHTAGFTNNRSYFNSNVETLRPPLAHTQSLVLPGVSDATSMLVFSDLESNSSEPTPLLLIGEAGTPSRFVLFDRTDSSQLWEVGFPNGDPSYVPAYSNGLVLLGGPSTTTVKAVAVSDGSSRWEDSSIGSSVNRFPVLTGELALYHGEDRIVGRNPQSSVVLWQVATTASQSTNRAASSLHGNRAYFWEDSGLRAINVLNGQTVWLQALGISGDFASLIATEKYVFTCDPALGVLGALSTVDGSTLWQATIGEMAAAGTAGVDEGLILASNPGLALANDRLIVFVNDDGAGGSGVQARNPDTGEILWEVQESSAGIKYGLVANQAVYYYQSGSERIRVRDISTGNLIWSLQEPAVRGLTVADDALFVLLSDRVEEYRHAANLYFAQFADGRVPLAQSIGVETTFATFTNPNSGVANVVASFFGSDGQPAVLSTNQSADPVTSVGLQIQPMSSASFQTTGDGDLQSGWILVESDQELSGSSIFQLLDLGTGLIEFEAGVAGSLPTGKASLAVRLTSDFPRENTGFAAANTLDEPANVTMRLLGSNGTELARVLDILGPGNHFARFTDVIFADFFDANPVDGVFEATIEVISDIPLVLTVIRTQEGFQMSSLPVAAGGN